MEPRIKLAGIHPNGLIWKSRGLFFFFFFFSISLSLREGVITAHWGFSAPRVYNHSFPFSSLNLMVASVHTHKRRGERMVCRGKLFAIVMDLIGRAAHRANWATFSFFFSSSPADPSFLAAIIKRHPPLRGGS